MQSEPTTQDPVLPERESPHLSLRDRLRQATRTEHDQLEAALDLMRPGFDLTEYRALLARYHGFYASFEDFLAGQNDPGCSVLRFYGAERCKQGWLQQDREFLGQAIGSVAHRISRERFAELFPSAPYLLGAIYVIEGSMLGGMVLSRHFSRTLGLSPDAGLRFFSGYGAATKTQWQALLQLLEDRDRQGGDIEPVLLGARRMFSLLQRQLVEDVIV